MIKKAVYLCLIVCMLLTACGKKEEMVKPAEPSANNEPASLIEPAESSEAEILTGRQDGERFEEVIILEGMEETVRYEHIRNDALGFELDYDYESFVRHRETDRECFISIWDNAENPENYLEVTSSAEDTDMMAASISERLSAEYTTLRETCMLERAGSCIRIDASETRSGGVMPDLLQMVYIIPAPDGCRVATAHYSIESAEGFGRRFSYILNTLVVIDRNGASEDQTPSIPGTWQTASMGYESDGTMSPEYYVRFTDSEVVYGHMKNGEFVPDHADPIIRLSADAAGGVKVQAQASYGTRYTYQTSESDQNVLEYYETWNENEFSEMYRGGASLSSSS